MLVGLRTLVGAALALTVLTGCGGAPEQAPALPATPTTTADAAAPDVTGGVLGESRPVRLSIPSLEMETGLVDLGLQADGSMEIPDDGATAGWYENSPTPGELGPAVLAAHVDWRGERGVFYDLRRMEPGDEVTVERTDGSAATFAVTRVAQYAKDAFPTEEVYGDVDSAQLRLITCGGDVDTTGGSYRDNIVVYAELV